MKKLYKCSRGHLKLNKKNWIPNQAEVLLVRWIILEWLFKICIIMLRPSTTFSRHCRCIQSLEFMLIQILGMVQFNGVTQCTQLQSVIELWTILKMHALILNNHFDWKYKSSKYTTKVHSTQRFNLPPLTSKLISSRCRCKSSDKF